MHFLTGFGSGLALISAYLGIYEESTAETNFAGVVGVILIIIGCIGW